MSFVINIYTVEFEYEREHVWYDDEGYLKGHEPGCGRYITKKETKRIRAEHEVFAKAWVERYCSNMRNVKILHITYQTIEFDASVVVERG